MKPFPEAYNPPTRDVKPGDVPMWRVDTIQGPMDVRMLRRGAKLTQRELAQLLGVTESTVTRLESGKLPFDDRWSSHLTLLFAHLLAQ